MKRFWRIGKLFAVISALSIAGCGLSAADKEKTQAVEDSLKKAVANVAEQKAAYDALKGSAEYSSLKMYDEREKWSNNFDEAEQALKHGREVFDKEVKAIVAKNDGDDTNTLHAKLNQVESSLREARTKAKVPAERVAFIAEVRKHAPEWVAKAEKEQGEVGARYTVALGKHTAALKDHPGKKDDLLKRFAPVQKTQDDAAVALKVVKAEQSKGEAADCLQLGDSCKLISGFLSAVNEQASRYEGEAAELYRNYTKILVDMRADYFVKVARTSWDESSDWNTDTDYHYGQRQVSEEVFDYFDDLPDDVLLATYGGWSGCSVKIDQGKWDSLGIDPKEGWPGWSHSDAEYWLAETPVVYYHKYTYIDDANKREGDWEQVTPEEYEANWDNLGMALVTKPFGVFESETLKQPTPPGLAQVGNPRYGEWKKDASGSSFWEWYGQYRFMSMLFGLDRPYYYPRAEWDDWGRNYRGKSAYYGSEKEEESRYGTYGTTVRSSPRYTKSTFSSQGGFKEVEHEVKTAKAAGTHVRSSSVSVRGAGPAGRSGGPGGGGK